MINCSICSKSDEWRNFNNFGRSMFAGLVDRVYFCCFISVYLYVELFVSSLKSSFLFYSLLCCWQHCGQLFT